MLRPDGLVPNGVMAPEGGIDESVVAVVGTPGAFRNRCSNGWNRKETGHWLCETPHRLALGCGPKQCWALLRCRCP